MRARCRTRGPRSRSSHGVRACAARRGHEVLARLELIRVTDRVLLAAGTLLPAELRSLDAVHLATAQQLGSDLARVVTYDERMRAAAQAVGCPIAPPR
jgi:uncharacterized protein